ncbi:MAG: integrin alpha [Pseudomonadota bacterium]
MSRQLIFLTLAVAVAFARPAYGQSVLSLSEADAIRVDGAASGDLLGWAVDSEGDFNGDGFVDLVVAAQGGDLPAAAGGGNNVGHVYVVFGGPGRIESGLDLGRLTEAGGGDGSEGFVLYGTQINENIGNAVANAGDVNGDGIDDLLIGSANLVGTLFGGGGYVVFGRPASSPMPAEFFLSSLRTADNVNSGFGVVFEGSQSNGRAGTDVISAGDFNGDGLSDIVFGNFYFGAGFRPRPGLTYIAYGRTADNPWPAQFDLVNLQSNLATGEEGFAVLGDVSGNALGSVLASPGDLDGDGMNDLFLGSPTAGTAEGVTNSAGFIVPGRISGPGEGYDTGLDLTMEQDRARAYRLLGDVDDDAAGTAAAGLGDVNGDGRPDLAVSATLSDHNGDDAGTVYVLFGRAANQPFPQEFDLESLRLGNGAAGFAIVGTAGLQLGTAITPVGDHNGDGIDDFAIGATADSGGGSEAGATYLVYGSRARFPGQTVITDLVAAGGAQTLRGESGGDKIGDRLGRSLDLDRDGSPELLVGARLVDAAGSNAGRVYVIDGQGGVPVEGFSGADSRAWFDPDRGGEGILLEVGSLDGQPTLFATWYTYRNGEQLWLVAGPVRLAPDQALVSTELFETEGGSFGDNFDADDVALTSWGTVEIERLACDRLAWRFVGPDGNGALSFVPLLSTVLALPGCATNAKGAVALSNAQSGAWWDPARAGEGIVVDLETRGSQPTVFFSWFTYFGGNQRWLVGSAPLDLTSSNITSLELVETRGARFGNAFDAGDVINSSWGTVDLSFSGCDGLAVSFSGQFEGGTAVSGQQSLVRFTGDLAGLACP